jgi:dTDP-4-dehydrorhamnose reductase
LTAEQVVCPFNNLYLFGDAMRIVVIGAGYLGRWIAKIYSESGDTVISTATTVANGFVSYDFFKDDFAEILKKLDVDTIIFAANVEKENDSRLLVQAARRFADAVATRRVVYISSDAIFDGKSGGYSEDDIPSPVTMYGKNLLAMEAMVASIPNHLIVRPSYLYGRDTAGLHDIRTNQMVEELGDKTEIFRFSDMYKSPMDVADVARLILTLEKRGIQGVVHVAGQRQSVYDFSVKQALRVGVDPARILPVLMPADNPSLLRDTSLDTALLGKLIESM